MKHRYRKRLVIALAAVGLAAAPAMAPAQETTGVQRQLVAIPAYWGPNTPDGMAMFQRMAQNGPTNDLVVVNGSDSQPETPFNSAWATAIKKLHDSGRKTLTYVDSGYLGFDFGQPQGPHKTRGGSTRVEDWLAQIKSDVDGWYSLYGASGVDGIFVDQITSSCGTNDLYVNYYKEIRDYIRTNHPGAYIVMNPGESPEQCYVDVADTIMSMERDMNTYMNNYTPPAWQLNYPDPKKFWHAVYATPGTDMKAVIQRTKENNAGYVYVTDRPLIPFPWDTLAAYWDNELLLASGINDTTPPATPAGLTATARSGSSTARVYLNWQTPADNVAVRDYEVFRNGVSIGRTYNNAFTVTGLAPSTTYTFSVRATDVAFNVSAPTALKPVTTPPAGQSLTDPKACLSPTMATYEVTYNETFTHHRVLINSDNDPTTGYSPGLGYDHLIESGLLYRSTGPEWENWVVVPGVAPLVSNTDDVYKWRVPVDKLEGAKTTHVLVYNGWHKDGAVPEAFSDPVTVTQTPTC